jgi:hypothetical protein
LAIKKGDVANIKPQTTAAGVNHVGIIVLLRA